MRTSEGGWPQEPPTPRVHPEATLPSGTSHARPDFRAVAWNPNGQWEAHATSPQAFWGARQHLGLAVRRLHICGAAWPPGWRVEAMTPTWRVRQGRHPDSPVLAVLSIPTSTLPPSPPLRLLCAEAAFRCLVLQGGERAREGRLTPAKPRRQDRRDRRTSVGVREGGGEERTAHGKGKKRQSQY